MKQAYYTLCQGRFGHIVSIEDWWDGSYTCTSNQHDDQALYGKHAQFVFSVNADDAGRWATLPPAHVILLPEALPLAQSLFFLAEPRAVPAALRSVRGKRQSLGHVVWNGQRMGFMPFRQCITQPIATGNVLGQDAQDVSWIHC